MFVSLKYLLIMTNNTNDFDANYRMPIHNENDLNDPNALDDKEYFLFILFSIFNAHYLPWIKNTSPYYEQNFNDRFDAMLSNLEMAFPNIKSQKAVIQLAKKHCFKIERKFKFLIESISFNQSPVLAIIDNSKEFWLMLHINYQGFNNCIHSFELIPKHFSTMNIPVIFFSKCFFIFKILNSF